MRRAVSTISRSAVASGRATSTQSSIRDDRGRGSDLAAVRVQPLAQRRVPQLPGEPGGQRLVDHAADIDLRRGDLLFSEHKQHPDGVGEPQMRIGQRPQLVLVVLRRLMIGGLSDFDRQQIVGDRALVHHDIESFSVCEGVLMYWIRNKSIYLFALNQFPQ